MVFLVKVSGVAGNVALMQQPRIKEYNILKPKNLDSTALYQGYEIQNCGMYS